MTDTSPDIPDREPPDIPTLTACKREMALGTTPDEQLAELRLGLSALVLPVREGQIDKQLVVDELCEHADGIGLSGKVGRELVERAIGDALEPRTNGWEPSPALWEEQNEPPAPNGQGAVGKEPTPWRWHGAEEPADTRQYLVKGLVPTTGVGLISGQWGTYKSFVATDLSAAVITETLFLSFPVMRKGGVLFFAMEGQSEVTKRLTAALAERGHTDALAPFAWIDTCPRLLDPTAGEKIAAMVKDAADHMHRAFNLPVALVIIDTAGKAAGYARAGDENDTALAKIIMKNLADASRSTGAFFFGVDHFGKDVSTGTRGASSKEDDSDVVLALLGEKGTGGAVTNPRLAIRKRRSGPNGQEFSFRPRVVQAADETTLVIDWATQPEEGCRAAKPDVWAKSLRLLKQTMMNLLVDHGTDTRPFPDGPSVRAVDLDIVRAEFYASHPAEGDDKAKQQARKKAFQRAVKDAQAKRLVGVRDISAVTYVWLANPAEGA